VYEPILALADSQIGGYEWDEEKSERNREKHGLSFEDAENVFAGPCVTFVDNRFDYEETRLITREPWKGGSWSSSIHCAAKTQGLSR